MSPWRERLRQLQRYPSALAGLAMIAALIGLAIYAMVAIPYGQALELWRGGEAWRLHPVNAGPVWADRLTGGNQPETIVVSIRDAPLAEATIAGGRPVRLPLACD
jgi:peptide/nickel transport system permease protein